MSRYLTLVVRLADNADTRLVFDQVERINGVALSASSWSHMMDERDRLAAEVSRLTVERDAASARLHEVATLCATVEQERDRLTGELADARNALDDAADEVANWGAYAAEYFQQKHDLVGAVEKLRALAKGKSSITTADQLRAELEKETAHSKHLAGAVSRKVEELIAVENQCGYYRMQYRRAEQVRKEACEANVKAQAAMSWMADDLERSRKECEALRESLYEIANTGFLLGSARDALTHLQRKAEAAMSAGAQHD